MQEEQVKQNINKEYLIGKMTLRLKELRLLLLLSQKELALKTGISADRIYEIEMGQTKMSWNNYLTLLYFFLHNEKTNEIIEKEGLFSEELKRYLNVVSK